MKNYRATKSEPQDIERQLEATLQHGYITDKQYSLLQKAREIDGVIITCDHMHGKDGTELTWTMMIRKTM